MVIVRRTPNGSYRLAELNSTISKLWFAAFQLVPYHAHSCTSIPVTQLVECEDLVKIYLEMDEDGAKEDTGGVDDGDRPEID